MGRVQRQECRVNLWRSTDPDLIGAAHSGYQGHTRTSTASSITRPATTTSAPRPPVVIEGIFSSRKLIYGGAN
jgi:hypothetical protein